MSQRSDALAAMRGEHPARIPFIGRMNLWYNYHRAGGTLPERYQGWEMWDIQRDLNIGIFGFGAWTTTFFKKVIRDVEINRAIEGNQEITVYVTPYGSLRTVHETTDLLRGTVDTGSDVERIFKGEKDYDALQYLIEHTEVVENYEEYGKYIESIGEDGLALPYTGWVPLHEILWRHMGVETFYYELQDRPDKVERLHQAVLEQQRQILRLGAHCPAEAIEVGGNYDEHLTPAHVFNRYFAPFYKEATKILGSAGKILVVHGDGNMKKLLGCLLEAGVQVVEALTPKPATSIDIREVRALWGDKVAIWGGIPYSILTPLFSDEEFEAYVTDLYRAIAPGDRFILGFGDNVPTDAHFHRLQWLAEFNQGHGTYPLKV